MAEPTQSMLVALADAVVAALNGATAGTFTTAFTAARKFAPLIDLKDAPDLTKTPAVSPLVLILPGSDDEDRQRIPGQVVRAARQLVAACGAGHSQQGGLCYC